MSNPQDASQPIGESSTIHMPGEDTSGDIDHDDPHTKPVWEENMLVTHSQGDVGDALATP